jgi:hypothetical protein
MTLLHSPWVPCNHELHLLTKLILDDCNPFAVVACRSRSEASYSAVALQQHADTVFPCNHDLAAEADKGNLHVSCETIQVNQRPSCCWVRSTGSQLSD